MAFLIGGANTLDDAYSISNSLRFNGGGNAEDVYLTRDYSSAGNQVTWTFSCWVKRTTLGEERPIFAAQAQADLSSGDPIFGLFFHTTDQLRIWTNAGNASIYTNRVFRDVGAWYHIHLKASSSSPYYNLYINGVEETSFNVDNRSSYPGGNDTYVNSGNPHFIGGWRNGSIMSPGMYLADVAIVDGTAHAPTDFAETNDNGVWVPKKPNVSAWGTNGCFLEFKQTGTSANASGIGADTSGQGNHMSVVSLAATDVTTDTPTNNFCTWNPLDGTDLSDLTFSEGNLKVVNATGVNRGTLAAASGKWYWEIKQITTVNASNPIQYGVADTEDSPPTHSSLNNALIAYSDNALNCAIKKFDEGTASTITMSEFTSISQNDIINFAFDADTAKLWVGKNGTWLHSGNPAAGSNEVASTSAGNFFTPCLEHAGVTYTIEANFGNAPYSISSGNADANGYGNFEYEPPTGFYALCTKNLADYG